MDSSEDPRKTEEKALQSDDQKQKPEDKRQFINEKVVKKRHPFRRVILRGLMILVCAVLFGVVAAVVFVAARPVAERAMYPQPETSPVTIPQDEVTEPAPTAGEEQTRPEDESEPIENLVQEAVESYRYQFSVDDADTLLNALREVAATADASIVTVHAIYQDTDWFDNLFETEGSYAGAVIAQTETEYLIMTVDAAVEDADAIKVTFTDGAEADARMKQQDTISGIAIVSVEKEELTEDLQEGLTPLILGNSNLVKEGDMLIAVGAPAGVVHSSGYGFVSAIITNTQIVDHSGRMLYAGITANAEKGTFMLNLSGEMIGWAVSSGTEGENPGGLTQIMCISDYKKILETLSNGLAAPCLGIEGQAVTDTMKKSGMPAGIYVLNAVADRPCYDAGVQSGDIITAINDQPTLTGSEFRTVMDALNCGQLVHLTVERGGIEGYAELEFSVTVGAR